jgi:hypothetical protein
MMIAAAAQWFVVLFVMAHGQPTAPTIVAGPFAEPRLCYGAAANLVDAFTAGFGRAYRGACTDNPEGAIAVEDILTREQLSARAEAPSTKGAGR